MLHDVPFFLQQQPAYLRTQTDRLHVGRLPVTVRFPQLVALAHQVERRFLQSAQVGALYLVLNDVEVHLPVHRLYNAHERCFLLVRVLQTRFFLKEREEILSS